MRVAAWSGRARQIHSLCRGEPATGFPRVMAQAPRPPGCSDRRPTQLPRSNKAVRGRLQGREAALSFRWPWAPGELDCTLPKGGHPQPLGQRSQRTTRMARSRTPEHGEPGGLWGFPRLPLPRRHSALLFRRADAGSPPTLGPEWMALKRKTAEVLRRQVATSPLTVPLTRGSV